jgi:hypothetical protein
MADCKPILILVKDSKPNIVGDLMHEMIESKPPEKTQNDSAQRTVEAEYNI